MPCPQGEDVCKLLKDYALEGGKETCRRKVNERTCSSAIPQSSNLALAATREAAWAETLAARALEPEPELPPI